MNLFGEVMAVNRISTVRPAPSITFEWVFFTPEKAEQELGKNFDKNRNKKQRIIKRLSNALRGGYFYPTHQGIAYDSDGCLIDGQNRLQAIVSSGVGAWLAVARGVNRAHIEAIDRGGVRLDYDNINMSSELSVSHVNVAVAKAMYVGLSMDHGGNTDFTGRPLKLFLERHFEAITFVCGWSTRGLSASVLGVLAKAYYHADKSEVQHFLEVLKTGVVTSQRDQPIIKLRDFVMDRRNGAAGGHAMRTVIARKTMACFLAFRESRAIKYLQETTRDPFRVEGALPFVHEEEPELALSENGRH